MSQPGRPRVVLVAAVAANRVIGAGGKLPWRLPEDLRHFKALTLGHPVIMGRKTWDSVPEAYRPLPGRRNIVLSRRADVAVPAGVAVADSLARALAVAEADPDVEGIFVVGGGDVYAQAVASEQCRYIVYTRILHRFGCDTFFPPFEDRYALLDTLGEAVENQIAYRIERWARSV